VFWPARPAFGSAEPTSRGGWARVGQAIAVWPRVTWVTAAPVPGVMALACLRL